MRGREKRKRWQKHTHIDIHTRTVSLEWWLGKREPKWKRIGCEGLDSVWMETSYITADDEGREWGRKWEEKLEWQWIMHQESRHHRSVKWNSLSLSPLAALDSEDSEGGIHSLSLGEEKKERGRTHSCILDHRDHHTIFSRKTTGGGMKDMWGEKKDGETKVWTDLRQESFVLLILLLPRLDCHREWERRKEWESRERLILALPLQILCVSSFKCMPFSSLSLCYVIMVGRSLSEPLSLFIFFQCRGEVSNVFSKDDEMILPIVILFQVV